MKRIPLTKGLFSLVDDEDYEILKVHKRCINGGYAGRRVLENGKSFVVYMHIEIMKPPPGKMVDHINGNKLDNRRCNLRICTHRENSLNSSMKRNNTSGFRGVVWSKHAGMWRAMIFPKKVCVHLGYFEDILDAARAYNNGAKKHFGEFARLNKIP